MVAKVVRPDRVDDSDAHRALQREAAALRRLAHPVLVRGFDAVTGGPHPHVLLEYVEGPTLRALLKRHGALPLEQAIPLALHMASVLHYLAREEMVHLDIKPANVVMGVPPKLIDLSLVRTVRKAGAIDYAVGTDAYMAPEQCDPQAGSPIGPATDVWGLGATMYHALTGSVPFPVEPHYDEAAPAERYPQLVEPPLPLPDEVPAALRELVEGALAAQPTERPSASELALTLQPLVDSLPRRLVIGKRGLQAR
jgi:serine/threonine protein kinase